jgi:RimJ/RimL family protein N-acetyltransferase
MNFTFVPATETDLPLILSLLKETAEAIQKKGLQQWKVWLSPQKEQTDWMSNGLKNREFYFVLNTAGQQAGMFRLSNHDELYWGKQEDQAMYLHSLLVRKEFSGQNAGTAIIKQIEKDMLSKNIPVLRLDCHSENQWLCNYYESLGFVKAGQKQMPQSLNNLYQKTLIQL